jgi:hypothetical protein
MRSGRPSGHLKSLCPRGCPLGRVQLAPSRNEVGPSMAIPKALTIRLRIVYDGTPPNRWDGDSKDFGMQDKENVLQLGTALADGRVVYDVSLAVKPAQTTAPIFLGDFVHGPPKERFLYLSWRNADGSYAQRLKLPLAGITWSELERSKGLVGEVAPSRKPRVPGGSNLGGTRGVVWRDVNE